MSSLAIRQKLVDIATKELGVHEENYSNSGKRVEEYQAATSIDGTGWPWCAAFVCWCIREWGKLPVVLEALKMTSDEFEVWRPKTASAFGFHSWAHKHGLLVMTDSPAHVLHTADIMTFDMSHVGLVRGDEGNLVYTIEGNTSLAGSRDGGGVYKKIRQRFLARAFVRLLA